MDKELLTIKEAAYELESSTRTVRRWIDDGRLEAVEVGPTKRIRVPAEAVEEARRPRKRGQ